MKNICWRIDKFYKVRTALSTEISHPLLHSVGFTWFLIFSSTVQYTRKTDYFIYFYLLGRNAYLNKNYLKATSHFIILPDVLCEVGSL